MVIIDRLGKGIVLNPLEKLGADYVARRFIKCFIGLQGIPSAVTSDRGNQFVNDLWSRIERRLSTAYHPETDGQTERTNSTIEAYFRMFCD
jgi:hypothetical protein